MSNNINDKQLLLIGTGPMAVSYAKVLIAQKINFKVVGRGEVSADEFNKQTGIVPITGGLKSFLECNNISGFTRAIIATGSEILADCLKLLIDNGIYNILIEKPGAISVQQLVDMKDSLLAYSNSVFVAYNRRFYSSVFEVERLIKEDGGLEAMTFEFTEWTHKIDTSKKLQGVLNNWFFANSTHVVDLAFYLAGKPVELSAFSNKGSLDWHEKSIFSGAGITKKNVLFSYLSHWESAGRWSVELLTSKNKYILRPLEGILIQPKGSLEAISHEFENSLDIKFKPGIYKQVEAFYSHDDSRLINILAHIDMSIEVYSKMLS